MTDKTRAQLQARASRMLERAQHNNGPHVGSYGNLAMDVATFKVKGPPVRMTGDVVYKPATIFRAGNYPDKEFSLTPSELKKAAASFGTPLNVDYEHIDGPLDGHLGQLVAVEPSTDGSRLHGMLAVPRWLDGVLPKAKLSATWDRASKTLVGLALVRNPRVPDAALFAAFSVDQVARGEKPLSSLLVAFDDDGDDDDDDDDGGDDKDKDGGNPFAKIAAKRNAKAKKKAKFGGHDGMVPAGGKESQSGGALDGKPKFAISAKGPYGENPDVAIKSGRKVAKFAAQAIHDISASRGAVCRVEPEPATGAPGPFGIVRFDKKGRPHLDEEALAQFQGGGAKAMQGIHDVSLAMGAACAPTLYGQTDLAGGGPWQWQYPGVKDEGRHMIVPGGMTQPHFSQEGKTTKMGRKQKEEALFSTLLAQLDGQDAVRTPATYAYSPSGKDTSRGRAIDSRESEELSRLREENRLMRQQGIYDRAVSFADKVLNDGHILPVEREHVIRQHMQAAHDDTFVGTASFSGDSSRVSLYEESVLTRPKATAVDPESLMQAMRGATAVFNNMRTAVVPGAGGAPGVGDGAPMPAERRSYLLNLADSGTMTGRNLARPGPNSSTGAAK